MSDPRIRPPASTSRRLSVGAKRAALPFIVFSMGFETLSIVQNRPANVKAVWIFSDIASFSDYAGRGAKKSFEKMTKRTCKTIHFLL